MTCGEGGVSEWCYTRPRCLRRTTSFRRLVQRYRGPTLTQTILSQTISVQWVFIFFFGIFSEFRDMLFTKKNMYIQSTIKVFIYKETVINISAFSVNTISCDFLFNSLSKCSTKLGFILCDQGGVV